VARDLFGWAVIYALHARACIERGRVWQAEHYVGAVRDHALSLACRREGLPAVQARGHDDLSAATLSRFEDTHVVSLEPDALRTALAVSVLALLHEGAEARLPHAGSVAHLSPSCTDERSLSCSCRRPRYARRSVRWDAAHDVLPVRNATGFLHADRPGLVARRTAHVLRAAGEDAVGDQDRADDHDEEHGSHISEYAQELEAVCGVHASCGV
jgi:hypothetical protein